MGRVLSLAGVVVLGLLATALPANAATEINDSQPFDTTIAACLDEPVHLSGSVHVVMTLTVNGNLVKGMTHVQPQGVKGIGLTTGAVYQGTGVAKNSFSLDLRDGSGETDFINNFQIVGRGNAVSLRVHEHVTISNDGTVRVKQDSFECG
jgi:hypothetical protein